MADLDWERAYRDWRRVQDEYPDDDRPERWLLRRFGRATREGAALHQADAWAWVERALTDKERRIFIYLVFEREPAPAWLGEKLLELGVRERNPSFNKYYIRPAVRSLGPQRVFERLLVYLETGSNEEKAGAANATYWAGGFSDEENSQTCLAAIRAFRDATLREFVANPDLRVRQCLIPRLSLDPADYPKALRPLVSEAVAIARNHGDDYIRHRVGVQLGETALFRPLPDARH